MCTTSDSNQLASKNLAEPNTDSLPKRSRRRISSYLLKSWKTSRPWLLARLPELQPHGWTRTKLFRAGRLKYPVGHWGIAFSRNWLKPDVDVKIGPGGEIQWTWTEPTGKKITQASRPYL